MRKMCYRIFTSLGRDTYTPEVQVVTLASSLAAMSEFLTTPAAEVPHTAEPSLAEHQRMAQSVDYVTKTIHQLRPSSRRGLQPAVGKPIGGCATSL
jgi:hypothetical protein